MAGPAATPDDSDEATITAEWVFQAWPWSDCLVRLPGRPDTATWLNPHAYRIDATDTKRELRITASRRALKAKGLIR